MHNYRFITLILFLLSYSFLNAQELTVKSFTLSNFEVIKKEDKRPDREGQPCALLKIQMVDQLEKVEGNVIGEIVDHGTEKWIYVTDGTYQLRIYPKNHLPINFNIKEKDYGVSQMESDRVYNLTLTDDKISSDRKTSDRAYLKLMLTPKTALVTIDGRSSDVDSEDGSVNEVLKFGRHVIVIQANGYVTRTDTIDFRSEQSLNIVLERKANPTVTIRSTTPNATIYVNNVRRGTGECVLQLSQRDYIVKVECEGYQPLEQPITVTEQSLQQFVIPALKQLLGSLNVNFKPTGSSLAIDGRQRGTTPTIISELPVGTHRVEISKDGYKPFTNSNVVIEPNKEVSLSGKLERIEIKQEKQKVDDTKGKKSSGTIKTDKQLLPNSGFYAEAAFQVGTLMGVGAVIGGYISNFNVEASYLMGLSKSEDIYWSKAGNSSVICSYKPTALGFRVGYGFVIAEKLRLTPQVGATAVSIRCSDGDSKGNAISATLGLRADYAVAPHFIIFATPEASFAVSKSDVYQQLIDVSSKVKSWATGFNARIGLSVYF